jgi:hypothetical protein
MHGLIKDHLETYLRGASDASRVPPEFVAHLKNCEHCGEEVTGMQEQSDMVRSLRAPSEVEARAGFYGRVMDRIEARRNASIWSVFLQPAFGRRVVIGSLATVLVLGGFLALTETESVYAPASEPTQVVVAPSHPDGLGQDRQRDRNTILVDLATYHQ